MTTNVNLGFLLAILSPLAILFAQDVANADTVNFGPENTDVTQSKTLPGEPCTANGQELTQVVISATAGGVGSYRLENQSTTSSSNVTVTQFLKELSIKVPGLPGGDALIDTSQGPLVFGPVNLPTYDGTLDFGGTSGKTVDPSFNIVLPPPPNTRTYTAAADLNFFKVANFKVDFVADADDNCSFSTGNSVCNIVTNVQGSATVTYTCKTLQPALQCEYKTLTPNTLNGPDGTVAAQFKINNIGDVNFTGNLTITDTMGAKMTYLSGSPIPSGGPPTYTWSGLSLAQGNSLIVNYQAKITGLNSGEQVCNSVVATANGTTSNTCQACVSRGGTTVPAVTPLGLAGAALLLPWVGVFFWRRRQRL